MKVIGRNQVKRAQVIFGFAYDIKSHTLENGFEAKDCDKLDVNGKNWMYERWMRFNRAKLIDNGDGNFRLQCCSNHWVDFKI